MPAHLGVGRHRFLARLSAADVKFGSRSHPAHLLLKGWTTIKPGDLSRMDAVAEGHGTQVSIPV